MKAIHYNDTLEGIEEALRILECRKIDLQKENVISQVYPTLKLEHAISVHGFKHGEGMITEFVIDNDILNNKTDQLQAIVALREDLFQEMANRAKPIVEELDN